MRPLDLRAYQQVETIYNSRNFMRPLDILPLTTASTIYNSRNFMRPLDAQTCIEKEASTIVEILCVLWTKRGVLISAYLQ